MVFSALTADEPWGFHRAELFDAHEVEKFRNALQPGARPRYGLAVEHSNGDVQPTPGQQMYGSRQRVTTPGSHVWVDGLHV
jgi:hypothetical protein